MQWYDFKNVPPQDLLVVQWLSLHTPNAGGTGSIPGWGTKIPHTARHGQKTKSPYYASCSPQVSRESLKKWSVQCLYKWSKNNANRYIDTTYRGSQITRWVWYQDPKRSPPPEMMSLHWIKCNGKLKIELPYDAAIPLLGIYLEKTKTLVQKDTCTPVFTAALFTLTKMWKQPKSSSTDEWVKKMWCIYIQWNITQP